MADACVHFGHCGTNWPGWLNGSHPAVADGAVQRKVCFTDYCKISVFISVRNCGAFYVYKLRPLSVNLRYCGNGFIPPTPVTPGSAVYFFLTVYAYDPGNSGDRTI